MKNPLDDNISAMNKRVGMVIGNVGDIVTDKNCFLNKMLS